MAAKGTKPKAKTPKKASTKTPVKKGAKAKKTAVKATKKTPARKPKQPVITAAQFEKWFLEQDTQTFLTLTQEWNQKNLKVKIKNQKGYDDWFNYFKDLPAMTIRMLFKTGQDILPTEAYAALARWVDIVSNPGRIDKIHQAAMSKKSSSGGPSITAVARKNDRLGVLMATRDMIAEKLEKGAGARDTAALTREMTEIMTQINDYEKRLGPKKTTKLGKLLQDVPDVKPKRSRNGGARVSSFKTRVTIEDVEG